MLRRFLLTVLAACSPTVATSAAELAVNLDSRWELFVDDFLVANAHDAALMLATPQKAEIVLNTDAPWEGPVSAYFTVLKDGDIIRLYYRGSLGGGDHSDAQVTCVAESRDGIHFTRPKLGLIAVNGSTENNIIWRGVESHNFAPFIDRNPAARADERYKALGGLKEPGGKSGGLYAFASADGLHWRKLRPAPVITEGALDSLNLAFWDETRGHYACYSRLYQNRTRAVQSASSVDFLTWNKATPNIYAEGVQAEHFYTSATIPCPGAEHLLLAFPKRFVLTRTKIPAHKNPGVSDAVFMSSRDGVHWDRPFLEAWVRPGLDERNWTERSNMTAWGIVESAPGEWSMYISEHYRWPDNRLRRLVLPRHRLASMHAGAHGGEFVTRPLVVSGKNLVLNYATSAAGSIQLEVQDEAGKPLPGFRADDMPVLFGDELDATLRWKTSPDLSALAGKTVRLRFLLKDADVYAMRFAP